MIMTTKMMTNRNKRRYELGTSGIEEDSSEESPGFGEQLNNAIKSLNAQYRSGRLKSSTAKGTADTAKDTAGAAGSTAGDTLGPPATPPQQGSLQDSIMGFLTKSKNPPGASSTPDNNPGIIGPPATPPQQGSLQDSITDYLLKNGKSTPGTTPTPKPDSSVGSGKGGGGGGGRFRLGNLLPKVGFTQLKDMGSFSNAIGLDNEANMNRYKNNYISQYEKGAKKITGLAGTGTSSSKGFGRNVPQGSDINENYWDRAVANYTVWLIKRDGTQVKINPGDPDYERLRPWIDADRDAALISDSPVRTANQLYYKPEGWVPGDYKGLKLIPGDYDVNAWRGHMTYKESEFDTPPPDPVVITKTKTRTKTNNHVTTVPRDYKEGDTEIGDIAPESYLPQDNRKYYVNPSSGGHAISGNINIKQFPSYNGYDGFTSDGNPPISINRGGQINHPAPERSSDTYGHDYRPNIGYNRLGTPQLKPETTTTTTVTEDEDPQETEETTTTTGGGSTASEGTVSTQAAPDKDKKKYGSRLFVPKYRGGVKIKNRGDDNEINSVSNTGKLVYGGSLTANKSDTGASLDSSSYEFNVRSDNGSFNSGKSEKEDKRSGKDAKKAVKDSETASDEQEKVPSVPESSKVTKDSVPKPNESEKRGDSGGNSDTESTKKGSNDKETSEKPSEGTGRNLKVKSEPNPFSRSSRLYPEYSWDQPVYSMVPEPRFDYTLSPNPTQPPNFRRTDNSQVKAYSGKTLKEYDSKFSNPKDKEPNFNRDNIIEPWGDPKSLYTPYDVSPRLNYRDLEPSLEQEVPRHRSYFSGLTPLIYNEAPPLDTYTKEGIQNMGSTLGQKEPKNKEAPKLQEPLIIRNTDSKVPNTQEYLIIRRPRSSPLDPYPPLFPKRRIPNIYEEGTRAQSRRDYRIEKKKLKFEKKKMREVSERVNNALEVEKYRIKEKNKTDRQASSGKTKISVRTGGKNQIHTGESSNKENTGSGSDSSVSKEVATGTLDSSEKDTTATGSGVSGSTEKTAAENDSYDSTEESTTGSENSGSKEKSTAGSKLQTFTGVPDPVASTSTSTGDGSTGVSSTQNSGASASNGSSLTANKSDTGANLDTSENKFNVDNSLKIPGTNKFDVKKAKKRKFKDAKLKTPTYSPQAIGPMSFHSLNKTKAIAEEKNYRDFSDPLRSQNNLNTMQQVTAGGMAGGGAGLAGAMVGAASGLENAKQIETGESSQLGLIKNANVDLRNARNQAQASMDYTSNLNNLENLTNYAVANQGMNQYNIGLKTQAEEIANRNYLNQLQMTQRNKELNMMQSNYDDNMELKLKSMYLDAQANKDLNRLEMAKAMLAQRGMSVPKQPPAATTPTTPSTTTPSTTTPSTTTPSTTTPSTTTPSTTTPSTTTPSTTTPDVSRMPDAPTIQMPPTTPMPPGAMPPLSLPPINPPSQGAQTPQQAPPDPLNPPTKKYGARQIRVPKDSVSNPQQDPRSNAYYLEPNKNPQNQLAVKPVLKNMGTSLRNNIQNNSEENIPVFYKPVRQKKN